MDVNLTLSGKSPAFCKRGLDLPVSGRVQALPEMPRSGYKVMSKKRSGLRIFALTNKCFVWNSTDHKRKAKVTGGNCF